MAELQEKQAEFDRIVDLANHILDRAHPDAVIPIRQMVKLLQAKWFEVRPYFSVCFSPYFGVFVIFMCLFYENEHWFFDSSLWSFENKRFHSTNVCEITLR